MKLFAQLQWFFRKKWKQYLGAIALLIMIALLQLLPPRLVGIIVDNVVSGKITGKRLILLVSIMVFTALLVYWLRYFWRVLLFGAAYRLGVDLRSRLYQLLSQQVPSFYLRHRTGDLMARATNDVDRVVFAAGEGVLTLVDSLIMGFLVLLIMSVQISWQLTLFALLPMPVMAALIKRDGQRLHQSFRTAQAAFSSLNNQTQENLTNIRMIKAFGLEKFQLARFIDSATEASEKNMQVARIDARFDPIIYLSIGLSNILAIIGGSWLMLQKYMTIGQLTSFIMYLGLMIWPTIALAWMFNIVERGSAAYCRIRQTLEEKIEIEDGTLSIPPNQGTLNVAINKFFYPHSNKPVLQDIQLTLSPKKVLGICGPTGSGKSTLLSLILRQFDVSKGEIRFHNLPLNRLILDQWRSRLAVVNQNAFLFSDSISANIALGRPDATSDKIEEVARLACVHEDIINFPKGYQTGVGERGVMLSGGQKQRLAIARALLLDAEILILDDALSAIDSYTENNILRNLRHWGACRTIIISAHRLLSLQSANEILVLENGRISQRGKHSTLLQLPGWYRDTYHYQQLEEALEAKPRGTNAQLE